MLFGVYREVHRTFFSHDALFSGIYRNLCARLEKRPFGYLFTKTLEDISKKMLFSCRECGIAAFNIWHFSVRNPNAPSIPETGPVVAAGKAVVRLTRTAIACGSGLTGAGQPLAGPIKSIRDLSRPAIGNWTKPPRGSIFTYAKTTRDRLQ